MANPTDARARLLALAQAPDDEGRLAEAALWIAAEEYADLDVSAWLARLDVLGGEAARRIHPRADVDTVAAVLNRFLFEEEGFRGNEADYYDPRNSFLNDVLTRRLGIPITLSVLYIDVAATAGISVRGVGLPGHFIARLERDGEHRLLDPFNGGARLGETDCHALFRGLYGQDARLDPSHLRPVTSREILTRMLGNLKGIYVRQRDWHRALAAVERIALILPEAPGEIRDRGLIHARLGRVRAAIEDWERYLQTIPDAPDAERVREQLRTLRQAVGVLN